MGGILSSPESNENEDTTNPPQQVVAYNQSWDLSQDAGGWVPYYPVGRLDSLKDLSSVQTGVKEARKVESPGFLYKNSITLEQVSNSSTQYRLTFVYDAKRNIRISVYLLAKETTQSGDKKFVSKLPDWPCVTEHSKGMKQTYRCNKLIDSNVLDQRKDENEDFLFSLIIELAALDSELVQSRVAYADISLNTKPEVSIIKQNIRYGDQTYNLEAIYGLETDDCGENSDPQLKDCVICLTDKRTTAVLPCRHLCLCSECALRVRLQNDKCPVCRQRVTKLLQLRVCRDDSMKVET